MTLLISAATKDAVVIVADRRLSWNGKLVADEANKIVVLGCDDARCAVAFCGAAKVEDFDVYHWLIETLSTVDKYTVLEILDSLSEAANRAPLLGALGKLPPSERGLTFVLAGFQYSETEVEPICSYVSNTDWVESTTQPKFTRSTAHFEVGSVEINGMASAVRPRELEALRLTAATRSSRTTALRSASLLRHVSRRSGETVSEHCNVVVIPRTAGSLITSSFHSSKPRNFVSLGGAVLNTSTVRRHLQNQLFQGDLFSGPNISPDDPCWCGSGAAFGRCHRRLNGSVYTGGPPFGTPTMFPAIAWDTSPLPIGREFVVQANFDARASSATPANIFLESVFAPFQSRIVSPAEDEPHVVVSFDREAVSAQLTEYFSAWRDHLSSSVDSPPKRELERRLGEALAKQASIFRLTQRALRIGETTVFVRSEGWANHALYRAVGVGVVGAVSWLQMVTRYETLEGSFYATVPENWLAASAPLPPGLVLMTFDEAPASASKRLVQKVLNRKSPERRAVVRMHGARWRFLEAAEDSGVINLARVRFANILAALSVSSFAPQTPEVLWFHVSDENARFLARREGCAHQWWPVRALIGGVTESESASFP